MPAYKTEPMSDFISFLIFFKSDGKFLSVSTNLIQYSHEP